METFELLEQLSEKSKEEIEYCILSLMLKDKIDFLSLNKCYIKMLELREKDNEIKTSEASMCISESFRYDKFGKKKGTEQSIQRRLYFLNKAECINTFELNKKYNYNEEEAKKLSGYNWDKLNK